RPPPRPDHRPRPFLSGPAESRRNSLRPNALGRRDTTAPAVRPRVVPEPRRAARGTTATPLRARSSGIAREIAFDRRADLREPGGLQARVGREKDARYLRRIDAVIAAPLPLVGLARCAWDGAERRLPRRAIAARVADDEIRRIAPVRGRIDLAGWEGAQDR